LIDILFTLIIFFLVTSVFEKKEKEEKEKEVELPRHGGSSLATNKEHPFYINVLKNGTYIVQGDTVDLDHLRVMLMDRFKEKPEQRVVIRGDAKAFHGQTTAALAAASQAGFPSVNIAWDTSSIE
jgi:biopolymer transport protein ExbD